MHYMLLNLVVVLKYRHFEASYSHFTCVISKECVLKYDKNSYANIDTIWTHLGNTVSRKVLQYYTIIGCLGTSFFYINGKLTHSKKSLKKSSCLGLNECFSENKSLSNADTEDYLSIVPYGGIIYESCFATRISIDDNQKAKSSMTPTPDPEFTTQVILRVHYQCYYHVHCRQEEISPILFQDL